MTGNFQRAALPLISAAAMFLSAGCTGKELHVDYTEDYLKALVDIRGVQARDRAAIDNFILAMSDLKHAEARARLEKAYAPELYFNDTVHTYRKQADVVAYMLKTADKVETLKVEVNDVAVKDHDYYLRWVMTMRFEMGGKTIDSKSIGMSHIRTDGNGQVVIHQDYWDAVEGLYQYIPLVGYMIGKVQSNM